MLFFDEYTQIIEKYDPLMVNCKHKEDFPQVLYDCTSQYKSSWKINKRIKFSNIILMW